jgi:hypothetical protein
MKPRSPKPGSASSETEAARLRSNYSTAQCPFSGLLVAGKQWVSLPVIDAQTAAAAEAVRTAASNASISLHE